MSNTNEIPEMSDEEFARFIRQRRMSMPSPPLYQTVFILETTNAGQHEGITRAVLEIHPWIAAFDHTNIEYLIEYLRRSKQFVDVLP